jgi:hypothetical protein
MPNYRRRKNGRKKKEKSTLSSRNRTRPSFIVRVVRWHAYHVCLPLCCSPLDHLAAIFSHHMIGLLVIRVGDSLVAKRVRNRNQKPLLNSRALRDLIMPSLYMRVMININTAPLVGVGKNEHGKVRNGQLLSGDEWGDRLYKSDAENEGNR